MATNLKIAVRAFGPFEQSIQEQFADFVRIEGIDATLAIDVLDLPSLEAALFDQRRLREGAYDLAFLNTDWLARAIHERAIADLAPLMKDNPLPDYPAGWCQSLASMPHISGGIYGLPYHDGPQCLIYRTDLIPRTPETWSEFHRIARETTDARSGRFGTVLAAFADGHNTVYDFCIHLWTRGGELLTDDQQPNLNCAAAIRGLQFYRSLIRSAFIHPEPETIDSVKSGMLFSEGRIAMMTNWFGFAAMCETLESSQVKGRVGIAPIPSENGRSSCSLNVYWFLAVASGSSNQAIAFRFIRHCLRPDMDKLLTLRGATGCRRSTWADEDVNRVIPYFHHLPRLHSNARSFPVDTRFHRLTNVIEAAVIRAIRTDDPVEEILDNAQRTAHQQWNEKG